MFCIECGQKLQDDAKFCSKCGKPLARPNNEGTEPTHAGNEKGEKQTAVPSSIVLPDMVEDSITGDSATISANGKYLAMRIQKEEYSSDYELQIMDTQSGKIVRSIDWKKDWDNMEPKIDTVSNDGSYIALTAHDEYWHVVNTETGEIIIDKPGHVQSGPAAFSGDNKRLVYVPAMFHDEGLKIISLPNGNELLSLNGSFYGLAYSHDGRYLASYGVGGETILWDTRNGSQITVLGDKDDEANTTTSIAFSPDGNRIVTAAKGRVIRIWDTKNGAMLFQFGKYQEEYCTEEGRVRFSPDGKAIVVCYYEGSAAYHDGAIKIINAETGEPLKQLGEKESGIEWASYTPDGKKLVSYSDNKVKFWVKG